MKRSQTAIVLLFAAALAGCAATSQSAPQPAALESAADYDALWRAALDVLGRRFIISRAEKGPGVIETDYLVGALSKTGFATNALTRRAAAEDFLHTLRRRAVVTLKRSGQAPVEVRVEKGRLVREHPDIVRGGTFSVGRSIERKEQSKRLWLETGRDEALEKRIVEEITSLYRARRPAPPS